MIGFPIEIIGESAKRLNEFYKRNRGNKISIVICGEKVSEFMTGKSTTNEAANIIKKTAHIFSGLPKDKDTT